jgi:phosphoribosylformimino-5-aminoimidazole carboxamide ribotide isomerase
METLGVKTIICTDISKDGVLGGTNLALYGDLSKRLTLDIIASGGVSALADVTALRDMGLYGAILGRALYTGGIDLAEAVKICEVEK